MTPTTAPVVGSGSVATDFASLWKTRIGSQAAVLQQMVELAPGTGTPLFLIHWTSGNVRFVRDFATAFNHGHPVYGFEATGLWNREEPLLAVPDVAACYLRQIRSVQPSGPYLLGGLCGGSQIAYEMATQLREAGEVVGPLTLVNAARGELATEPHLGLEDVYELRLASLRRQFGTHDLVGDLSLVMGRMRELRWIDDEAPAADFFWRQVLWAASMYAFLRCRLKPLDVPVNVFVAEESAADPEVSWHDVAPLSRISVVKAVTSGQIMQSRGFIESMRHAFAQSAK
ncbi:thioesterase domain-containing protein [Streptomyces erythrochromogenes]|uniref:thioesterase domain-containing protein n=1 Tax=Streptomyces erythrochromogenes TaxID=285574 RepID=UPI00343ADE21